jgi:hypothetical protein
MSSFQLQGRDNEEEQTDDNAICCEFVGEQKRGSVSVYDARSLRSKGL